MLKLCFARKGRLSRQLPDCLSRGEANQESFVVDGAFTLSLYRKSIVSISSDVSLPLLVHLDLSRNHIQSLRGFGRFVSLQSLILYFNRVSETDELQWLAPLMQLQTLDL